MLFIRIVFVLSVALSMTSYALLSEAELGVFFLYRYPEGVAPEARSNAFYESGHAGDPAFVVPLNGQSWVPSEPTIAAFGQHGGHRLFSYGKEGSPMYVNQAYRFLVHIPNYLISDESRVWIDVDIHRPGEPAVRIVEWIPIKPSPYFSLAYSDKNWIAFSAWAGHYLLGGEICTRLSDALKAYGLLADVFYTRDRNDIVIEHQSTTSKYSFVVRIRQGSNAASNQLDLYGMNFADPLPWQLASLQQPSFHAPAHDNKRRTEKETDTLSQVRFAPILPAHTAEIVTKLKSDRYLGKETSPELANHPSLNQLVEDLGRDPVAIAAFVQNEIVLTQGISPDMAPDASPLSVNPGKVDRNALMTYLEGQGSPWEQCALLVYMLRQAGYSAAYALAPSQNMFMRRDQVSNMLGLQLRDAVGPDGRVIGSYSSNHPDLVPVNYPWVVFYDEAKQDWIHLFPWLQDVHVQEGYNAYQFLPNGYRTAGQWIRRYLHNDPDIIKHIGPDGNDTAAVLFRRFLESHLRNHNKTLQDVGVHTYPQRRQYASWGDFPKPLVLIGKTRLFGTLLEIPTLFTELSVKVSSKENPSKQIDFGKMRMVDIYGRPHFTYFSSIGGSKHKLHMEMLPYFQGDESKSLSKEIEVDESDRNFKIDIAYNQNLANDINAAWSLVAQDETKYTYTIEKGVMASICVRMGHTTPEILQMYAMAYQHADPKTEKYKQLGLLTYLTGMTYYKKLTDAEVFFRGIHKVANLPLFDAGLSKLSPDLTSRSSNRNAQGHFVGEPILQYPQVDMNRYMANSVFNNSIRPDLKMPQELITMPFAQMIITDGSANEHQVLNDIYQDKYAISTVKLLQLAHKRHQKSGTAGSGIIAWSSEYRKRIEASLEGGLIWGNSVLPWRKILGEVGSQWDAVKQAIDKDKDLGVFTYAYMTPGLVYSDDGNPNDPNNMPSYRGAGTLIFSTHRWSALISGNDNNVMHGGYGSRLPPNTFNNPNGQTPFVQPTANNEYSMGGINRQSSSDYLNQATARGYYDEIRQQTVFTGDKASSSPEGARGSSNPQKWAGSAQHKSYEANPGAPFRQASEPSYRQTENRQSYETMPRENVQRMADQTYINQPGPQSTYMGSDYQGQTYNVGTGSRPSSTTTTTTASQAQTVYQTIHNRGAFHVGTQGKHQNIFEKASDPVNVITGAFYVDEVDISLPGVFPLEFRRNYNSENALPGDFGYGWKSNLVSHLVVREDGPMTFIDAAEADGTVLTYRMSSKTDRWIVLPKDNPQLTNHTEAGMGGLANAFHNRISKRVEDKKTIYTLTGSDGSKRIYEVLTFPVEGLSRERPYLKLWTDNRGNKLSFEYGEDDKQRDYGRIRRVASDNGNAIIFSYDAQQRVIQAQSVDGRIVKYEYDWYGDLVQVTRPDGSEVKYVYEKKIEAGKTNIYYSTHRLVEEAKPEGRRLINDYDEKGRVVAQRATAVGLDNKLYVNAQFIYKKDATKTDLRAETVAIAPGYVDGKDSETSYKIYDGLIYQIRDPLGQTIYQSWYLDADNYFDAEKEELVALSAEMPRGYPRSLRESVDKRGLRTTYVYDAAGNATRVSLSGDDLSGDGKKQIVSLYTYAPKTRMLTEESHESFSGDIKKRVWRFERESPYLAKRLESWVNATLISSADYAYTSSGKVQGLLAQETHRGLGSDIPRVVKYGYDDRGFLTQRIQETGTASGDVVEEYRYNRLGQVAQITAPSGASTKFEYDIVGRVFGMTKLDSKGAVLQKESRRYNLNGEIIEMSTNDGTIPHVLSYHYDRAGHVVAFNESLIEWQQGENGYRLNHPYSYDRNHLATTLYEYDMYGNLTRTHDPEGQMTEMSYDGMGRVVKKTVNRHIEEFSYEAGGLPNEYSSSLNGAAKLTYTSNGLLKGRVNADGTRDGWVYDTEGRVVREHIGGVTWETTYDDENLTQKRINPSVGSIETRIFDHQGNLLTFVDTAGYRWNNSYDALGRLVRENSPDGGFVEYAHDLREQESISTNALGEISKTVTDSLGRPIWQMSTGPNNETASYVKYEYPNMYRHMTHLGDGSDMLSFEQMQDANGRPMYKYNGRGSERLSYNRVGDLVSITDALEHESIRTYDYVGNSVFERLPTGASIERTYASEGRLTAYEAGSGISWNAEYDALGSRVHEVCIDAGHGTTFERQYTYHQGRLHTVTDKNGLIEKHSYDTLGRLSHVQAGADSTSYSYDPRGLLTQIIQTSGSHTSIVSRTYDSVGRISQEMVTLDGEEIQNWEQVWDKAGRRQSLRRPEAVGSLWQWIFGRSAEFAYDFNYNAAGQMTKVSASGLEEQLLAYVYGTNGLLNKRERPWNSTAVAERDEVGRPLHVETESGEDLLFTETLAWEDNGLMKAHVRLSLQSKMLSHSFHWYGFTDGGWLKNVVTDSDENIEKFSYDNNVHGGIGVLSDKSIEGFKKHYDGEGRVIRVEHPEHKLIWVLSWDSWGRLVEVVTTLEEQEMHRWSALYDGLGRRLRTTLKRANGEVVIRTSQYDPEVEFLELGHRVQEEGVDKQAWLVYGPDLNGEYGGMQGIGGLEAIVDAESGEVVGVVNDAFGNLVGHVVDALKPERKFVAHHSPIDVFGRFKNMEPEKESRSFAEKLAIELTWRTRRVDETGFYNLGARYYSPQLLEFISPDPAGFAGGPNLYAYANNDPVNFVDPDGRFKTAAWNTVRETVAGAWNHPHVSAVRNHPTFQGGVQAGLGAAEFGAGAAAVGAGTATGFTGVGIGVAAAGVGMMSHGADNIVAGARTVYQGYHNPTVTNQFFQSMGMSPGAASTVEMGMSFGMGVGAGAGMGMASRAAGAGTAYGVSQSSQSVANELRFSQQKMAGHIPGTPQYLNRIGNRKDPTSAFFGERSAKTLTEQAWERGAPVARSARKREYDFGVSVGSGPKGGAQTRVRVHQDNSGRIHGHPAGPERF